MYEYLTDLHAPTQAADKWIATSAGSVGSVCHKAGHVMYSAMKRSRDYYLLAHHRIGKEVDSVNSAVNAHPYLSLLVGVGVGAVLAYLTTSKMSINPE